MNPPAPCPKCGSERQRDSHNQPRCKPCERARQAELRELFIPDGMPCLTRIEVAEEMTRRGYKMTARAVDQTERRALRKLQRLWKHDLLEFSS